MASAISSSIIAGDGIGKPSGLLHPNSGIPILDTAPSTPEGTFTWQDLVSLKFDVPMQWHNGGAYYCNQRTLGLLCTMSDAIGRPLLQALPQGMPPFAIAGSPIIVVTQMPDCLPGNTPILYGNLQQAYTLVQRSGTMMTPDPYSGQYCTLYKFESRVGSAVTCGNAARLPSHQVSAMRDHYHGFSHPVLDLPPRAVTHLFAEFDQIASELRAHPKFVADDLQIAFCRYRKCGCQVSRGMSGCGCSGFGAIKIARSKASTGLRETRVTKS
jgi:hypothetical protein